jgi:hypothetical protein
MSKKTKPAVFGGGHRTENLTRLAVAEVISCQR